MEYKLTPPCKNKDFSIREQIDILNLPGIINAIIVRCYNSWYFNTLSRSCNTNYNIQRSITSILVRDNNTISSSRNILTVLSKNIVRPNHAVWLCPTCDSERY